MAEDRSDSAEEHLLSTEDRASGAGRTAAARGLVKWVLEMAMALIFAAWVILIFLFPLEAVNDAFENWVATTSTTIYKMAGPVFLAFGVPLLLITFLAIVRFIILGSREEELLLYVDSAFPFSFHDNAIVRKTGRITEIPFRKSRSAKHPRVRLSTFPVLVDGPFGVVSAAEFIGICLVVAYVLWAVTAFTLWDLSMLSQLALPNFIQKCEIMLQFSGLRLATVGLYCLAFLFLPVARGSVLLRLIGVPFEQAVRYHVWLGHLTMSLFTLHGLCYVTSWAMLGTLLHEITSWSGSGIAFLPGAITLLVGLSMWVTSLPPVRKKQFELFLYTHQLYMVFVVFFAMHVGDFNFSIAASGIFLFMLDRFLRFCQSRRTVKVISATCLPCGTVELALSKPRNLRYNALSFVFLRIRELSWLQWHPFSVSSSPLDGENHLSVHIKVLGGWTKKLNGKIIDSSESQGQNQIDFQLSKITASVEGPYGHELPYHLMYENLVLVAGGIGISPFLAILSDILHRAREGNPCLPSNILLVWAIKKSDELPLISFLEMESSSPLSPAKLHLDIDIYITRESEPSLEEGHFENGQKGENPHVSPISSGCPMSVLVGTGNNIWSGLYVMSSILGFLVLMTALDIFYINRFSITIEWFKALLSVVCMIASVIIFGGLVVFLWYRWEQRIVATEENERDQRNLRSPPVVYSDMPRRKSVASRKVIYGSRPNFKEISGSVSEQWGHVDIGVIVCGPATLETSVAKECRSRNLNRGSDSPVFHFNSHSFDV